MPTKNRRDIKGVSASRMPKVTSAYPTTQTSPAEACLPVSPGLEDLDDRVSFMGVEVAKGKGGPFTPDIKRFEGDVTTARNLKQPIVLEGNRVLGSPHGKESGRCQ
jgi:hypothetical protein